MQDPQKAAGDLERARAMVLTKEYKQYTQDCVKALGQSVVPPRRYLFAPSHFINPALPMTAERVLATIPEQEQLRLAAQVAQQQLGVAPEAVAQAAPHIVDAAKNLHRR